MIHCFAPRSLSRFRTLFLLVTVIASWRRCPLWTGSKNFSISNGTKLDIPEARTERATTKFPARLYLRRRKKATSMVPAGFTQQLLLLTYVHELLRRDTKRY
jgi:hypothetical protein